MRSMVKQKCEKSNVKTLFPSTPCPSKIQIHLNLELVPTKHSSIQKPYFLTPLLKIPKSKTSQPNTPICPYLDSTRPSTPVPQNFDNTIDYYETVKEDLSPIRLISYRLERKDQRIDILKVEFEEFKILDMYIKN
jgi:hypothetical protein